MTVPMKIALAGNPNSGKSSLFNALTGLRQKVGNYPGVTVDRKTASIQSPSGKKILFTDVPGSYSLYPHSEDEKIAAEIFLNRAHPDHPDRVIFVADATQLRRSLLLCTQIIDLGIPVVLALNMADLLEKTKVTIDAKKLSLHLGIPVVLISALKKNGLEELLKMAVDANVIPSFKSIFKIPDAFSPGLEEAKKIVPGLNDYGAFHCLIAAEPAIAISASEINTSREKAGMKSIDQIRSSEIAVRYDSINEIILQTIESKPTGKAGISQKLDKFFLHPIFGYFFFLFILGLIFQALFTWAQYPMDAIGWFFSATGEAIHTILPDNFISTLLVDGLWAGLSGIVVFIPQIALLFMFISILEESGYMSRVVFLMDRIMRPFGFSGKSVIPLIGGMACAVPSIMMTRTISNKFERLITIMVIPLMSCSARIPVYVLLISIFVPDTQVIGFIHLPGLVMTGMYLLGFLMALFVAWVIKLILKYNASETLFLTEMPAYRNPRWTNVGLMMFNKSKTFVVEAGKVIIVISLVLTLLCNFGPPSKRAEIAKKFETSVKAAGQDSVQIESLISLRKSEELKSSYAGHLGQILEPVIRPMGFDWKIGICLISSFAAREVFVGTMTTLYSSGNTDGQNLNGTFSSLRKKMMKEINPATGKKVYSTATAVALLIFYAFAMQCMSTLAVTRKETGSWKLTLIMLAYMTGLAYLLATIAYQILNSLGW